MSQKSGNRFSDSDMRHNKAGNSSMLDREHLEGNAAFLNELTRFMA